MTLGGRAAEEIVFGEITTGASNDLEKVTATAKQMVMRFGMSEKLGPRVFGHDHGQPFLGREFSTEPDYSDEIAREIDDEVRRIIESAHQRAREILTEHQHDLDEDLRDPRQARDDREGGVPRPARRQERRGGVRRRGGAAARAARAAGAAPTAAPSAKRRARCPRPGSPAAPPRCAGTDPSAPSRLIARLGVAAARGSHDACAAVTLSRDERCRYRLMGIVNVTPDSFSDGGASSSRARRSRTAASWSPRAREILDVGGESTRPGAEPVAAEEELARVLPVVEGLAAADCSGARPQISIDTPRRRSRARRSRPARALVNDVSALRADREMAGLVAEAGADCCLMHMLGEPRTMQREPRYEDVVDEVKAFLEERLAFAVREGIAEERDPARPRDRLRQDDRAQPRAARAAGRARRARPPARDRHLPQELPRADRRCAPAAEPRRRRAAGGDDRHERARARARGERVPRPRGRSGGRGAGGGCCYVGRGDGRRGADERRRATS